MARRSTPYTQADLTRLIKAAVAAGVGVSGVRLTRDSATLFFGDQKPIVDEPSNEWDEVLKQ